MSHTATATTPQASAPIQRQTSGPGVNFGRVLRSEWIKVTTVPSTVVLLSITFVVMVGLAALGAWGITSVQGSMDSMAQQDPAAAAQMQAEGGMAAAALTMPTSGFIFGQLLMASLAVVLIASEWATGMIRSTMVAVPKRIPALLGKNLIIAVIAFVIGTVAAFISYFVIQPILAVENLDFALSADGVLLSIFNTGAALALVSVIAMSIGTLLRNTAGAIVTIVGLLFVIPILVVTLLGNLADWIPDAARFLPDAGATQMLAINIAEGSFNQWQGALVLGGWALVLLVISLIVTKKRDV